MWKEIQDFRIAHKLYYSDTNIIYKKVRGHTHMCVAGDTLQIFGTYTTRSKQQKITCSHYLLSKFVF